MSDETLDVLIAAYLIPDLAQQDFGALVKLAEEKTISTEGIVLVTKDADGELRVEETGDHAGRKGLAVGGGIGLVVGLFAPPLLAVTAAGARGGGGRGRKEGRRPPPGLGGNHRRLRP